jgi:ketosteroid isomerase-like protein
MGDPAGNDNLETARRYLQALERGETGAALRDFFAPEVVFEAFPNRLRPLGETLNLASALKNVERGKKAMSHQKYKIKKEIADVDQVALEVEWVGTLAVPFESVPAGGRMRVFFAMFLEFREGKIVRQRNYDCYEAW